MRPDPPLGTMPILIAGPTASGKSAVALALAEQTGGVIINADSMQVYAELRVLTARPTQDEEARAPHRLYGHVAAADAYSTGRWLFDVQVLLDELRRTGQQPIFVGGTGLYFKALLEGLSPVPDIPSAIREHWRGVARAEGAARLHKILRERDPQMAARLQPEDAQRHIRALEVLEATGQSLAEWQRIPGVPLLKENETTRLVVTRDREDIYCRCDARFEAMVREGALEEVKRLAMLKLPADLPIMRALGVRPLMAHLEGVPVSGRLTLEAAMEAGKRETRQYVKRQITWIKRHMMSWQPYNKQ